MMVGRGRAQSAGDRGTSLLELVISLAIASLIIFAMFTAMDASTRVTREATERQHATSEAERVSNMILTDLRRASRASVAAQGSTLGFQMYDSISVDPLTGVPNLVLSPLPVTYSLAVQGGGDAMVRVQGTRTTVVSRSIASFAVNQITPGVVSLQVTSSITGSQKDPATGQFVAVTAVSDMKVPIVGP